MRSPPRAARLHLGRAGCPPDTGAQPSPAEGQAHKASPGPTIPEAPRASPTRGETPGPQGEDCRQTKGTSGPQVWADLQVAHSAVRFYPSAINPLFPHTHGAHATQGRHPSKPGPPAEAHPNKGQKSPEGARDISSLPKPDEQPAARQERQWFGKEKASKPTEALGAGLSATLRQRRGGLEVGHLLSKGHKPRCHTHAHAHAPPAPCGKVGEGGGFRGDGDGTVRSCATHWGTDLYTGPGGEGQPLTVIRRSRAPHVLLPVHFKVLSTPAGTLHRSILIHTPPEPPSPSTALRGLGGRTHWP